MKEEEELQLALLSYLLLKHRQRISAKVKRKHKVWVKEIFRHRKTKGAYHQLVQELRITDRESHFR